MNIETEGAFNRIVAEIDRPETDPARHLSIELDEAIREITRAAAAAGKSATLTLTLTVKPGPENRREWTHDVKKKIPRLPRAAIVLYADQEGEPYDHNPFHAAGPLPGVSTASPPRKAPINAKVKE